MQITIALTDGGRHTATLPYDGADLVTANCDCPNGCVRPEAMGIKSRLKIRGTGIERRTHDTYYASAVALCCGKRIGTLETKVSTVFGIQEDEMVLAGPWKVF